MWLRFSWKEDLTRRAYIQSLIMKSIDALIYPHGYQPLKFNQLGYKKIVYPPAFVSPYLIKVWGEN